MKCADAVLAKQAAPLSQDAAFGSGNADRWTPLVYARRGFSADVTFGLFEEVREHQRGTTLLAPRFVAVVDFFASLDVKGFDQALFVDAIETADACGRGPYRACGRTWFVRSGFHSASEAGEAVIFCTKFMFREGHSRLAAFEITLPASQKPRFAEVVERIEDTL